jgi:hypothetical protein
MAILNWELSRLLACSKSKFVAPQFKKPEWSGTVTAIETTAVQIAAGPAKGLIDALLGPKIERIKKWSLAKDITRACRQLIRVFPATPHKQSMRPALAVVSCWIPKSLFL